MISIVLAWLVGLIIGLIAGMFLTAWLLGAIGPEASDLYEE